MKMPECMLQAYYEQLPRLRAERALEAAGISALPWMKAGAQERWYKAQHAAIDSRRTFVTDDAEVVTPYVLTFNGTRLALPSLRQKMAEFAAAENDGVLGRWISA